jgi:hypothetical protein
MRSKSASARVGGMNAAAPPKFDHRHSQHYGPTTLRRTPGDELTTLL